MENKNYLEYRPEEPKSKKPNTTIERSSNFDKSDDSPLINDFKRNSPYRTLEYAKEIDNRFEKMTNKFKDNMAKETIDFYQENIDEHNISEVFNKRKDFSKDIKSRTENEIFPFIYKVKNDLEKNIKSFMLETYGKELNLREAKNKTDAILNQISKNVGSINVDAIYMDTLYNFCLINKVDMLKEFIFEVQFLHQETYSNEYKSKELESVINESFEQLNIKNDKDAKKLEQFLFSSIYPSLNNKIVKSKNNTLKNLEVFEEAEKLSTLVKDSLNKTLNISNNEFLNAIEDFLKANKTLEILLQDYMNSLLSKHELRKT